MSMSRNLQAVCDVGAEAFTAPEQERWACPGYGGLECVHTPEGVRRGHGWL